MATVKIPTHRTMPEKTSVLNAKDCIARPQAVKKKGNQVNVSGLSCGYAELHE